MNTNKQNPIIIHHFPCADGFGAAYAAWLVYGENAEYIGVDHDFYPTIDVAGRDVFMLDFSFPRPMLETMRAQAKSLTIIDHHKSARDALAGFQGAIFDMTKSGARLAWEFFHPAAPVPLLIQYIEDRDLWAWKVPRSADFLAVLDTKPFDFNIWDRLAKLDDDDESREEILNSGADMNIKFNSLAKIMAEDAEPVRLCGIDGHKVNCISLLTDKVGEYIYLKNGTFAISWRIQRGKLHVSLRSRTVDVAEIAMKFGGGGHPNAAAFRFDLDTDAYRNFMSNYIMSAGEV